MLLKVDDYDDQPTLRFSRRPFHVTTNAAVNLPRLALQFVLQDREIGGAIFGRDDFPVDDRGAGDSSARRHLSRRFLAAAVVSIIEIGE